MGILVPVNQEEVKSPDQWVDLDDLEECKKCAAIALLINLIPSVKKMQDWLNAAELPDYMKATAHGRKLTEMGQGKMPPSVWLLLRWIIASNTSYIREIQDPNMTVKVCDP